MLIYIKKYLIFYTSITYSYTAEYNFVNNCQI